MENTPNFIFLSTSSTDSVQSVDQQVSYSQIENLQKKAIQSFKYCQAKKLKTRYIRQKKIQEMKLYQQRLLAIMKKKTQEIMEGLIQFSDLIIKEEQQTSDLKTEEENQNFAVLKDKIASIKDQHNCQETKRSLDRQIIKNKLKRVSTECEEQLQKMQEASQDEKTDQKMSKLINRMEGPFKKMCSYLSILSKEIKEL